MSNFNKNLQHHKKGQCTTLIKFQIKLLILLSCNLCILAIHARRISSTSMSYDLGSNINSKSTINSKYRAINKQQRQRQQRQSNKILGDLLIHGVRGGASEVVDDHDHVLVVEGQEGAADGEDQGVEKQEEEESARKNNEYPSVNENVTGINGNVSEVSEVQITDISDEEDELDESDQTETDGYDVEQESSDEYEDETEESEEDETQQDGTNEVLGDGDEVQPVVMNPNLDHTNEIDKSFQETIDSKQTEASNLRIKGKQFHDDGDFQSAAKTFQKAAVELDVVISIYQSNSDLDREHDHEHLSYSDFLKLTEERATCRLHEALCHLKNKNFADSIISCTDVLMDGVQIVPFTEEYPDGDEKENEGNDSAKEHQAVVVRISPNGGGGNTATSAVELSPAVRARAYHRRAKARLALGDTTGALDDARSAAFLGDRNAVALYGKLMRESGGNTDIFGGNSMNNGEDAFGSDIGSLFSSASPLQSLFSGDENDSSPMGAPSSFDMLSSLLGGPDDGANAVSPFGGLGGLGGLGSMLGGTNSIGDALSGNGGGMDGLAKSVISSLTKRIDDESTQEMVCSYLNGVDASQITSLTSMAGVPLSTSTVDRIVGFANGVTPKGMRKTIGLVKRLIFVGNVLRKTFQVIGKYKHLLVVVLLIAWVKSAILRPVVLGTKAAKKTAETISKAAFII